MLITDYATKLYFCTYEKVLILYGVFLLKIKYMKKQFCLRTFESMALCT